MPEPSTKLRCIIVDDEPLARQGLTQYVADIDFLELLGSFEHPVALTESGLLPQTDLLFLDIQMPKLNGMDYLRSLRQPPMVVFTTAHAEHAVEGFALEVLDYLLKPIPFARFLQAARKARQQHSLRQPKATPSPEAAYPEAFFVKTEQKYEQIRADEILFVEGMQNYVRIHTDRGIIMPLMPLKQVKAQLDPARFYQTHKSYIVALDRIEALEGNTLHLDGQQVPLARSQREAFLEGVIGQRLLKKE